MRFKTVIIVLDISRADSFSMMLARVFGAVVNVRRAVHILEVVADIKHTKPHAVYYPSDINQQLIHHLLSEARTAQGALRFVVIGCRGLTAGDAQAVKRRAQAA